MDKVTRKKLRNELKEFITPVMEHICKLVTEGKATDVLKYQHRNNNIEAHFASENGHLVVYVIDWYGETIAFKIEPQQLANTTAMGSKWIVDKFADGNTQLIGRVYKSLTTLH
jgi:hypothetical protein